MKLSIVIPILDSHEVLRRQLLHWERIGIPDDTEIIIVDDGSNPPLQNTSSLDVTIYKTHDSRPWTWALARNIGATLARGEYLLMFEIDHIITRELLDFVRGYDGDKVLFLREFAVLDGDGVLTQDRDVLEVYGLPKDKGLKVGPLPNNFAMRKDVFWKLGGYREDLVTRPYPQGEDRLFKKAWLVHQRKHNATVAVHRPVIYVFPVGKLIGDVDADPQHLFHSLTRKTERNHYYKRQLQGTLDK